MLGLEERDRQTDRDTERGRQRDPRSNRKTPNLEHMLLALCALPGSIGHPSSIMTDCKILQLPVTTEKQKRDSKYTRNY